MAILSISVLQSITLFPDGSILITIEVVPNQELERVILGFGQHMQVIEPRLLRHRMKKELQVAALQYEMTEK